MRAPPAVSAPSTAGLRPRRGTGGWRFWRRRSLPRFSSSSTSSSPSRPTTGPSSTWSPRAKPPGSPGPWRGPSPHGHKDAKLATAGDYKLDDQHVGVIAAVSHVGFSHSIFRFGKVEADLHWDPQSVGKSTLKVVVDTASIETNVPDFAKDLS